MSQPIEPPDYRDKNGEYLPISLEGLAIGLANEFDLFTRSGEDYFLIKPRNMAVDIKLVDRYRGHQPYVYIRATDRDRYFKALNEHLSKVMKDPGVGLREKAALLSDCAVEIIDHLFADPGNPNHMNDANLFSQECVSFIGQHQHAFLHLVELSNHDHYTYAHSVGVSAYSIALAQQTGQYSKEQLSIVGLAGLLHDIGKSMVDPAIINKRGPLNEDEWIEMKKHPEYGAEILRRHRHLPPIVALSAEAHHESLLGTGYPKRLHAAQLDPVVRIVSLADAFSALTTKRSYSPPKDSLSALLLLKENVDKKFDPELFKRFVMLFLDPSKKAA